jgi:hypothetical protein
MIKRNSRNIGKKVKIFGLTPEWNGREGIITGFRGDQCEGIPYVCVFIFDKHGGKGSIYPFSGRFLKTIKSKEVKV